MASIVDYARIAHDPFSERPFCPVDALCLSWLAYLRFPVEFGVDNRAGARLVDLADPRLLTRMTTLAHNSGQTLALFEAMAASPRFANVRACLYVSESDEDELLQFSAVTFVLPDGTGSCVCYRGTDDTLLGWQENFHLACAMPIAAQRRATGYLQQVVEELGGGFWVAGHSKGGALASYACATADDATRTQVRACLSFDGPGLCPEIRSGANWHDDVPFTKVVPRESVVGMLFERSQAHLTVVRCDEEGILQHAPFSWELDGCEFACEQGLSYDAWRFSQRVNDWLERMGSGERLAFADLLAWLVSTTGETSCSGLLRHWNANAPAMRAALEAAPAEDRALLQRVMDDLVATLLLGSAQEYERPEAGTPAAADAAARRMEDATARINDRLSKLDRLTGR